MLTARNLQAANDTLEAARKAVDVAKKEYARAMTGLEDAEQMQKAAKAECEVVDRVLHLLLIDEVVGRQS